MSFPSAAPSSAFRRAHRELADYFERTARDTAKAGCWRADRPRALAELPHHLTLGEDWRRLEETLCDLRFIEAKCAANLTYGLVTDYLAASAALPETRREVQQIERQREQLVRYTGQLIDYARACHEARDRQRTAPAKHSPQRHLRIPVPKAPPAVRPWTPAKIKARAEKILQHPTRLERLRIFAAFVSAQSHNFARFAGQPGFVLQQAFNFVADGPVGETAQQLMAAAPSAVLSLRVHPRWRPGCNPYPAVVFAKEGSEEGVDGAPVSITADGRCGVSLSNGAIRVWDLESGECKQVIAPEDGGYLGSLAMTPDGRFALIGHGDDAVRLWDLVNGQCLHKLEGHKKFGVVVAMTPDGALGASGSTDSTMRLWDLTMGKPLWSECEHRGAVSCVALAADGARVISGGEDSTVRIWDTATGRCLRVLRGHRGSINGIAITLEGRRIITVSGDDTVRAWNAHTGRQLWRSKGRGHSPNAVAVTADSRWAVTADSESILEIWDVRNGRCARAVEAVGGSITPITHLALSADGSRAFTGSYNWMLAAWDLEHGGDAHHPQAKRERPDCVAFTPDGRVAVTGDHDARLAIWDPHTARLRRRYSGKSSYINVVAITPDGTRVVFGSGDSTVRVTSIRTGRQQPALSRHKEYVAAVALTPDGRTAVSGSNDKTVCLWDLHAGKEIRAITSSCSIEAVAVSPDGWLLAFAGNHDFSYKGETAYVRNLRTGSRVAVLRGSDASIHSLTFTPDGRRLVSAGLDNHVRVWDIKSAQCLHRLEGHTDEVNAVVVTADGRRIISGSRDMTVRVWDLMNGRCLAVCVVDFVVRALALHGHRLAVAGQCEDLRFYELLDPEAGPPIITFARVFDFERGQWEDNHTAWCQRCGRRFAATTPMLQTVEECSSLVKRGRPPCLNVPQEAFDEPRLMSECPHCRQPVRLNPFVAHPCTEA